MSISEKSSAQRRTLDQKMGQLSAVMMPLIEAGALGFVTYVFIYSLCISYLLSPPMEFQSRGITPRKGTAIALMTVYFLLLGTILLTWLRLLLVIWTDPGVVPLGNPESEKLDVSWKSIEKYDAFVSDYDGNPQWCDKCHNWKPDRAHHCRELNRCVRRMDHYCPWVGGIVSEGTHKFFIQLVFYCALYTMFSWIPLAIFLSERRRVLNSMPGIWIAMLPLCGIFMIFSVTMFFMTFWNLSINYTTIETLQRGGVHNIAMLATRRDPNTQSPRRNSSYKSEERPNVLREVRRSDGREYVVFQTQPLVHPWDLGSMENLRSVMGDGLLQWILPFQMSPCVKHEDVRGEYGWSRAVLDMAHDWERDHPDRRITLLSSTRRNRIRSS
ncbi:palmitoyltransferase pfa5 [Kalmusia sp. IMI 367209]|nr:palmitoyltransferase pfa5 [Kalmusia sp. IMI 367209]